MKSSFIALGIETSCDETGLALVEYGNGAMSIISEVLSSQVQIHAEYGGVVPELASREHLNNLPHLLDLLLDKANLGLNEIDLICVTNTPGLIGCLLVGVEFAKGLSLALNKPLVGVNHMHGHIISPYIESCVVPKNSLCLIVSGGHTELVYIDQGGEFKILSETLDDAAGETFDKSAALLGFEYPGGAKLAKMADEYQGSSGMVLPIVMKGEKNFSFSGLKTAISRVIKENPNKFDELCYIIQKSIVDNLIYKTEQILKEYHHSVKHLSVVGGVAANRLLRMELSKLASKFNVELTVPEIKYCTDNGVMIVAAGIAKYLSSGADTVVIARSSSN